MEIILILLGGLLLGCGITCLIVRPKLKVTKQKNEAIERINSRLEKDNLFLQKQYDSLDEKCAAAAKIYNERSAEAAVLKGQIESLQEALQQTGVNAEQTAEAMRQLALTKMQDSLSEAAEKEAKKYQRAVEESQSQYQEALKEASKALNNLLENKKIALAAADQELAQLTSKIEAAVAANIREEERKNKLAFYTLGLSEIDVQEVERIRSILPYLRNGRPLNKAIWECYYRNLTTDMLNRIIGTQGQTGIYKITCLLDNRIYIGQAVNLKDRLTTHIKCGLGIDTPNNKLYTAMLKHGVENFTFEVLEKCSSQDLNEKEKYWIAFYKSNEFGYNMSAGGSRSN